MIWYAPAQVSFDRPIVACPATVSPILESVERIEAGELRVDEMVDSLNEDAATADAQVYWDMRAAAECVRRLSLLQRPVHSCLLTSHLRAFSPPLRAERALLAGSYRPLC
ncbi:hypothetical protein C2L65_43000 [Paraburkholderia terrae]|uniref:Uncharacterized protein n=1 Tax=Paraburkholderia terrae TaxID=311230 RepID=A0A2I8F3K9_9BURK|nr:hypothetical protein C2L65_43000 [Paraburkholderia terrae]